MSKPPRFGATGRFPMPPLDPTDEGELQLGIAYDRVTGLVRIEFGKPVAWLALSPTQAREFARLIMKAAGIYGT